MAVKISFCYLLTLAMIVEVGYSQNKFQQKVNIGPAIFNVSRTTLNRNESYLAPIGMIGEYAIFLSEKISVAGQFNLALDGVENGIFIMGGAANVNIFLIGGPNIYMIDNYTTIDSTSQINIYTNLGIAGQSYNFSAYDRQSAESGTVVVPDQKDKRQGAFFGINLGLSLEYVLSAYVAPGIKLQFKNSFSDNTTPDITIIDIAVYGSFSI